ncbi:hypothetical protein ALC56_11132 [Trachymyrmex septentrionalis]|uniref:Uncharacterized protein n=1 Tax=Trachymyrmex septentrionalis TaxID=34720 RepID=A0A195F2F5_9HYME|nr:hypothetical protein ALC56_11132 [Trachymyrmex septentrionalis]
MMQHALRHSRAGEGRNICHSCFEQTSQVVGIYLKYSGYIFGIGSDNITLSNRSNMENFIQKIIFLEETTTYCFFQPCRLMFCLFGTFNQPSNLIVPCSDRTESSPSSFSIDETLAVSELTFLSPSPSSRVPSATLVSLDSLLRVAPVKKEIIFYLFKYSNFLLQVITLRLQLSSGNLQLVRHLLSGLTRHGDFCRLFTQSRNRFRFSLQFALHLFDLFLQRRHSLGCLL